MKRIGFVIAVLLALAIGGVSQLAFAAAASGPWGVFTRLQAWIGGGLYVGSAATADTNNKVTRMLSASSTIDFAAGTIVCEDSSGITVTGAIVGDPCFVGPPATLTAGGTGLHHNFTCYVSAADTVKVRACAAGTADNPGSVSFLVRVISSQ